MQPWIGCNHNLAALRHHLSPFQGGPKLKSHLSLALFATGIVLFSANQTSAQTQQPGGVVAVLDVKQVFDDCTSFQNEVQVIKQEIKAFEEKFRQEGETLLEARRKLSEQFRSNSDEFRNGEADLARQFSDLKVRQQLKQKEILEKEAALYYDTYQKISKIVASFAEANGITLVLRYESKPIDQGDRAQVIQGVNRRVVFQRNRDLTKFISQEVNKLR
jgi:Skp family chaperone for outer membrane proteins